MNTEQGDLFSSRIYIYIHCALSAPDNLFAVVRSTELCGEQLTPAAVDAAAAGWICEFCYDEVVNNAQCPLHKSS